jgi:hypothetical protein
MEDGAMRLNVKAMALAGGVIWGLLAVFLTGVANLIWPTYGRSFLVVLASLYPGYQATRSFGEVLTGTVYGFFDGLICGALLACAYNLFARSAAASAPPTV